MKIIKGDLLQLAEQGEFNVIVQGCNCFNTMGSGIARQIREKYPAAYDEDCKTVRGDYNKLGNYTLFATDKFAIVNAYTQYGFNTGGNNEDVFAYASFALILQKLAHQYPYGNFGFPKIGCGLAGGNEQVIMQMIQEFSDVIAHSGGTVTVVEFDK